MGVTGFECSAESLEILRQWGKPGETGMHDTLDEIKTDLSGCESCMLCKQRRSIVFGAGNPRARLVFVGEAPDKDEDMAGEPFMGEAGDLLTRIIEAIQLTRDQVYLCYVVKCMPPVNRGPDPVEINACIPYLRRQLSAIKPEFICALGPVAARALIDDSTPPAEISGRFFNMNGIRVLPTVHPADLLRHPEKKREVWQDMQMLMKAMGIEQKTS